MNECVDRKAVFGTTTRTCHAHKGENTQHKQRLKCVRQRNCAITSDLVLAKVKFCDGFVGLMSFESLAHQAQTQVTPNTYSVNGEGQLMMP